MRNRTHTPPLFNADSRPLGAKWSWTVTYAVASSGYPTGLHVTALRIQEDGEHLVGIASCDLTPGDDLRSAIEELATESMLAAVQPTITGEPSARRVVLSSHL